MDPRMPVKVTAIRKAVDYITRGSGAEAAGYR